MQMNDDGTITDAGTMETQKGYDAYKADLNKQRSDLESRDSKAKDKAMRLLESGAELLKRPVKTPEPVNKMAKGGSVKRSFASSRADGCAVKGHTRGKIC
jgi:hypothetical protein